MNLTRTYYGTRPPTSTPVDTHVAAWGDMLQEKKNQRSGLRYLRVWTGYGRRRLTNGGCGPTDGGGGLTIGGWCLADGRWRLTDGGWRLTVGGWCLADGGWRLTDGGWWVTKKKKKTLS